MSKRVNSNTFLGMLIDPSLACDVSNDTERHTTEHVERLRGQTAHVVMADEFSWVDDCAAFSGIRDEPVEESVMHHQETQADLDRFYQIISQYFSRQTRT